MSGPSKSALLGGRDQCPPSLTIAAELAAARRQTKTTRDALAQADSSSRSLPQEVAAACHADEDQAPCMLQSHNEHNAGRHSPRDEGSASLSGNRLQRSNSGATSATTVHVTRANQEFAPQAPNRPAHTLASTTPPITDAISEDVQAPPLFGLPDDQQMRAGLGLLTTSQLDASLPSPSLSPVTAAANLARHRAAARAALGDDDDVRNVSSLDLRATSTSRPLHIAEKYPSSELRPPIWTKAIPASQTGQRSLMDIPDMLQMFDAMPEELQRYVSFQMLKSCTKKTLYGIADVVSQALKHDPFKVLPTEVSQQITRLLDLQSLSQAAQVSHRWRELVNADEAVWKHLLEVSDFQVSDSEILRAIREGWGWQSPDILEAEIDLSIVSRAMPGTDTAISTALDDGAPSPAGPLTRLKRKATSHTVSSKRQKRKASMTCEADSTPEIHIDRLTGPASYAKAALQAVPSANIGLPSLRGMHLFKSIYRRHYMIRRAWKDESFRPKHLAFRAHHRHVVTCLLFDSDRIITGSDDNSIHVYDTQTGALRRKLDGHEGGVWALNYDGDTLVSGSTDRSVRIWDMETGECKQIFQGHTSTVRCLEILKPTIIGYEDDATPIFFPKEPIIITGSRDSTLRVWKLPAKDDPSLFQAGPPADESDNPYAIRTLAGHHNSVRAIAAYGDTLVSGSYDKTVRLWKISTGETVFRMIGHSNKVYSVVLDWPRNRCISGSMDNSVRVWSLDTGNCLFNLEGHSSLVGLLELNDGYLVSAAADSTLRIWNPETGLCQKTLKAHTGAITCFQHDGQKVISGSDSTLKMWDIESGRCVRDLLADLSGVWQVRFDQRRCVAAVQRNNITYIEVRYGDVAFIAMLTVSRFWILELQEMAFLVLTAVDA